MTPTKKKPGSTSPADDAAAAFGTEKAASPGKKTVRKKAAPKESAKRTAKKSADAPTKTTGAKSGGARRSGGRSSAPTASIKTVDTKGKNLIIVESPAKARTIERYLGDDFRVAASLGHVIDLPVTKLGVDIENGFAPEYGVIKGKKQVLDALKKMAGDARAVYLAPDPDREGEAIAHHIAHAIADVNDNVYRATFNEITKNAVKHSIANPRKVDINLFNAQQARRVLDRLVGYKLSPLLWRKVRRGLSAGRVQSVAVRLICDREGEIKIFKAEEYWTIAGGADAAKPPPFQIRLEKIDGEKPVIPNQAASDAILAAVRDQPFVVGEVIKKEVAKRPFPPFITSTLQQEASRRLRMTARRTMGVAQGLYEGVELGDLGQVGLITYMRTDSTRLSNEALGQLRGEIENSYGKNYVPEAPRAYSTKKGAQDAHEAIRPTDAALTPERVARYLDKDQLALYSLIWKRTMACQMVDARVERTRIEIPVGRYLFIATGSVIVFDGFLRVYQEAQDESGKSESDVEGSEKVQLEEDATLPAVEKGASLRIGDLKGTQHFTQPPPRYTEAGLIRELERQGIGRPSTYAAIISTIQDKEYAIKRSGTFHPTELGLMITELLIASFPKVMDVQFTAKMENDLDHVEDGTVDWVKLLGDFYGPFAQRLEAAAEEMRDIKSEGLPTEFTCEKCQSPMVVKWGRNGKFLACSSYPECRNTKPIVEDENGSIRIAEEEETDKTCPKCGRPMVVKNSRRGRFLACSGYPECKSTQPVPIGVPCPLDGCTGELVERQSGRGMVFFSCNRYPECTYSVFERPRKETCASCNEEHYFIGQDEKKKALARNPAKCDYPIYVKIDRRKKKEAE
jgi:DNA topoisomerase-1